MAFGNIEVGTTVSATLEIRNSGNVTLTVTGMTGPGGYTPDWTRGTISAGGAKSVNVTFSPTADHAYDGMLTVNGDQTSGTNTVSLSGTGTSIPAPRSVFGAGQYVIGRDVMAGRYYSDPAIECYWERESGLGGTPGEILASQFLGFDAGQWIVDIPSSDYAFKTIASCGTWFQTPRRGLQATIAPGMWRVGSQVNPGTYRATVTSGCYWERMRHFEGTADGIIANGYVTPAASRQVIEILATDAGFQSEDDCGTWTPVASAASPAPEATQLQSRAEIEANLAQQRRKNGLR